MIVIDELSSFKNISIHALREERDHPLPGDGPLVKAISIHALREERDRRWSVTMARAFVFQSTRSARSATSWNVFTHTIKTEISIHALREERDQGAFDWIRAAGRISIHALREERDRPLGHSKKEQ